METEDKVKLIANAFKAKSKGNIYVLENDDVLKENDDTGGNLTNA